jgi:hypothetical protein
MEINPQQVGDPKENIDVDKPTKSKIEKFRKKLSEILYRDLIKRAEVEFENQELPPKSKLILIIYSYINKFTIETLTKMLRSYLERKRVVDKILENIIVYF